MEQIIIELLTIQNQFRIYHWQTKSFSRHKAFGKIYSNLEDLIDNFVEICMGKHGRPDFTGGVSLLVSDIKELDPVNFSDAVVEFLIDLDNKYDQTKDSDLLNVRDEMMALINRLKYLLTLK
jgi:DNA-binding ferritin-like protein